MHLMFETKFTFHYEYVVFMGVKFYYIFNLKSKILMISY